MSVEQHETFNLTDEEVATITRFKRALDDAGVRGFLMERFAILPGGGELVARVLDTYMDDVSRTDASAMHEAGMSLYSLVKHARVSELFPSDFLPSEDAVIKCLRGFWAAQRLAESD